MVCLETKRLGFLFILEIEELRLFFSSETVGGSAYCDPLSPPRAASFSPVMLDRGLSANPCLRGNVDPLGA